MGESSDNAKRLLRREVRAARRQLTAGEVVRRSLAVCSRILALPVFRAAGRLVAYSAMDNEVDAAAVTAAALQAGKRVYYPAAEGEEFRAGGEPLPPGADDVLFLVPGVAFDFRGVRLGRGGGWYDRTLAQHPEGTRLGLGYEFQLVPELPEAPWDVRMHAIVTDARLVAVDAARTGQLKEMGT